MRMNHKVTKLAPLQQDTVVLEPFSYIEGSIEAPVDVIGTALAGKVSLERNPYSSLPQGHYRITFKGEGKFEITDLVRGINNDNVVLTLGEKNAGLMTGVDITIADVTGVSVGDYIEFETTGDQTYIIPATVLGRLPNGNWTPVHKNNVDQLDQFYVCNGFVETDKSKNHPINQNIQDVSNSYAVEVIVYGQVIESACRNINLTDEVKAKMPQIAWI